MSSPNDRLTAIQNIYQDALTNQIADLSKAQTKVDVASVHANLANAQLTYYTAEATALTTDGQNVEDALTKAKTALASVQSARADAATFATILGALNNATSAATTVLNLAKTTT